MRFFIFLFTFGFEICSIAREGLYRPSNNILNSALLQAAHSVVDFSVGSGVYLGKNQILTAYHVIANCGCPKNGVPKKCEREIRVPLEIDPYGNVTHWKKGKTVNVLSCGENADNTKSELFEKTLKTIGFNSSAVAYDEGSFWPRQDLALLTVNFENGSPPSVSVRENRLETTENLYAMGFPGKTLRKMTQNSLRASFLLQAFEHLSDESLQFNYGKNLAESINKLKLIHDTYVNYWSKRLEAYPAGSGERNTIIFGVLDVLITNSIYLSVIDSGAIERACLFWNLEVENCQYNFLSKMLKVSVNNAVQVLKSIDSQKNEINYLNADQTLRVSSGRLNYYQDSPVIGFPGVIWTDVDGASGNSGGPVFDEEGLLVGIVVLGPEGTSLGYVNGKGIGAVSHYGVKRLLQHVP